MELIQQMIERRNFGGKLTGDMKDVARALGAEDLLVHVKGASINIHDWRPLWGSLFGQIIGSESVLRMSALRSKIIRHCSGRSTGWKRREARLMCGAEPGRVNSFFAVLPPLPLRDGGIACTAKKRPVP